jgi:DNA polymerase I-like protein with 3'-5' exonuclease and polymerase domains
MKIRKNDKNIELLAPAGNLEKMKTAFKMNVPVVVDINTGNNWLEAH